MLAKLRRWLSPTWVTPWERYKLEDLTDWQLQSTELMLARADVLPYGLYGLSEYQCSVWWARFNKEMRRRGARRLNPLDETAVLRGIGNAQ